MNTAFSTLRIMREPSQWRDRGRPYAVLLNGQKIGQVANGESVEFEILPGHHLLRLRIDWMGSPALSFEIEPGEDAEFTCQSGCGTPIFALVRSLWQRDAWVELERKGDSS